MTREEAERAVLEELAEIAPEAATTPLEPDRPVREQIELDSYDFLQLIVRLHERLGVEIPEADYPRLVTLRGFGEYLAAR